LEPGNELCGIEPWIVDLSPLDLLSCNEGKAGYLSSSHAKQAAIIQQQASQLQVRRSQGSQFMDSLVWFEGGASQGYICSNVDKDYNGYSVLTSPRVNVSRTYHP